MLWICDKEFSISGLPTPNPGGEKKMFSMWGNLKVENLGFLGWGFPISDFTLLMKDIPLSSW